MKIELAALRTLEKEKGIPVREMLSLVSRALREAYRNTVAPAQFARVDIDEETGDVTIFAQERDEEGNLVAEWDDTPEGFERTAAYAVRQTILQRLRDAATPELDRFAEIPAAPYCKFFRSYQIKCSGNWSYPDPMP